MANTVAIIQARMGSTRLPGKVMLDLDGEPVLQWVTKAVLATEGIDEVWIATTKERDDDLITDWACAHGISVCRGSSQHVHSRFCAIARQTQADNIVRLTADCPLLDPAIIEATITKFNFLSADYVCNGHPPSWPDGLDCEIFKADLLDRFVNTEHITIGMRKSYDLVTATLCSDIDLSHHRWTLDTQQDYEFLCKIAPLLKRRPPSYKDVLAVLDQHPELRTR